jgi:diguanylate cyclase (GGDEF)-like protein
VHLSQDAAAPYVCIPLSAQGDTLGVLHLRTNPEHVVLLEKRHDGGVGPAQQLGVTLAEQAALAMANLKLRDTLKHQSTRDPLTGLFNRRYMEESLERELGRSSRKDRPLSIFMVDLDHFKKFNDTFGHEAGDLMLREFAYHTQKRMRGEDIVCRYGGEEFVVILVETPLGTAQKRAEQLVEDARRLSVLRRGQSIGGITLSIGIAGFPQHGASVESLLRAADRALYRAKEIGRDRLVVAESTEQETEVGAEKTRV